MSPTTALLPPENHSVIEWLRNSWAHPPDVSSSKKRWKENKKTSQLYSFSPFTIHFIPILSPQKFFNHIFHFSQPHTHTHWRASAILCLPSHSVVIINSPENENKSENSYLFSQTNQIFILLRWLFRSAFLSDDIWSQIFHDQSVNITHTRSTFSTLLIPLLTQHDGEASIEFTFSITFPPSFASGKLFPGSRRT